MESREQVGGSKSSNYFPSISSFSSSLPGASLSAGSLTLDRRERWAGRNLAQFSTTQQSDIEALKGREENRKLDETLSSEPSFTNKKVGTAWRKNGEKNADVSRSDISWSSGGSSIISSNANLDLSGFEQLENCSRIFSVKQREKLEELSQAIIWEMYFKVFNQRGQHIFSAGEVKDSCYRFSHWEFCIYVFTSSGHPLFTIAQRNPAYCHCDPHQGKIWMVHKEADEWLRQKAKIQGDEDDVENGAHVHVSLLSGAFLGHIWNGGESFLIYDIEYNPVLSLRNTKDLVKQNDLETLHSTMPPAQTPTNVTSSSQISSSSSTAHLNGKGEGDVLYNIYVESSPVGDVQINVKSLHEVSGLISNPAHCLSAKFPKDFEREDKILIMAFLLFKVRHTRP